MHFIQPLISSIPKPILNQSCRSISSCIHIKGLPTALPNKRIYDFFKSYGKITKLATFKEAPQFDETNPTNLREIRKHQKENYITHNRLPGQTAIIIFESTNSAIMAKEQLHWRPFPIMGTDENQQDILRPVVDKDVIAQNPRDRPILNILFETNDLRTKLRPWVQQNLEKSLDQISKWETENVEKNWSEEVKDFQDYVEIVNGDVDQTHNEEISLGESVPEPILKTDPDTTEKDSTIIDQNVNQTTILLQKMKLVQLQEMCKQRKLPYYGKKREVIARLETAMESV